MLFFLSYCWVAFFLSHRRRRRPVVRGGDGALLGPQPRSQVEAVLVGGLDLADDGVEPDVAICCHKW